jgi:hypothetical protein
MKSKRVHLRVECKGEHLDTFWTKRKQVGDVLTLDSVNYVIIDVSYEGNEGLAEVEVSQHAVQS